MARYEYECTNKPCGHVFEVYRPMTDESPEDCPLCDAPAKRRISTGAGFTMKGAGFHKNDYPSKAHQHKSLRVQEDVIKGLNRKDRCARGDFKQCRENDKILGDYGKFKDTRDRDKIKDEYETAQKETRRSLADKAEPAKTEPVKVGE